MKKLSVILSIIFLSLISYVSLFYIKEIKTEIKTADDNVKDPAVEFLNSEIQCLAMAIYHEARGSDFKDKASVADVVLNRVANKRYPETVCGVVKQARVDRQGNLVPNMCQFSWYCDGRSDAPRESRKWSESNKIARVMIVEGKHRGISAGATHFHNHRVTPAWADVFKQVSTTSGHIYYRETK